jgi:hypothetical protein
VVSWHEGGESAPFSELQLARHSGPYLLWRRLGPLGGQSRCPLIAVRSARQGERQVG